MNERKNINHVFGNRLNIDRSLLSSDTVDSDSEDTHQCVEALRCCAVACMKIKRGWYVCGSYVVLPGIRLLMYQNKRRRLSSTELFRQFGQYWSGSGEGFIFKFSEDGTFFVNNWVGICGKVPTCQQPLTFIWWCSSASLQMAWCCTGAWLWVQALVIIKTGGLIVNGKRGSIFPEVSDLSGMEKYGCRIWRRCFGGECSSIVCTQWKTRSTAIVQVSELPPLIIIPNRNGR